MTPPLRLLYVTASVLGDAGANAAELFPQLSVSDPKIEKTFVADFPRNKTLVETIQRADFLKLRKSRSVLRHSLSIARKAKQERVDVIHVFYRQRNAVMLIFIRIFLFCLRCDARLVMDHRSVNLTKGWRLWRKLALNFVMQAFAHHLAGNPGAVETNHIWVFRDKHIIDLGYAHAPKLDRPARKPNSGPIAIWFIGSLKPRNRKSEFLLDVFDAVAALQRWNRGPCVRLHVAGPTTRAQRHRMKANAMTDYHGVMPRADLYDTLQRHPGIGLAFMNAEFHEHAPSLKFAEYAIMRFPILASNTTGLRVQAQRMNMQGVTFVPEDVLAWATEILSAAARYDGLQDTWADAEAWSYPQIFQRQVRPLYQAIRQELHRPSL